MNDADKPSGPSPVPQVRRAAAGDPPPQENIRQRSWRISAMVDEARDTFDEGDVAEALAMLETADREAEGIWNDPHDDLTLFDHDDVLAAHAELLARAGQADLAFETLARIGDRFKRIDVMQRLVREAGVDPGRVLPLAEAMQTTLYEDKRDESRDGDLQWLAYLFWHLGQRDEAATTAAWIGKEGVRAVTFRELSRMIDEGETPPAAEAPPAPEPPPVVEEIGPITIYVLDNYHGTNLAEAETVRGFWSEAEAELYARARVQASIERFRKPGMSKDELFAAWMARGEDVRIGQRSIGRENFAAFAARPAVGNAINYRAMAPRPRRR